MCVFVFFFNDTATTEIYTLSLHDALPISGLRPPSGRLTARHRCTHRGLRSEEHTSDLQSLAYLVCRLLLEKNRRTRDLISHRTPSDRLSLLAHTPPLH